MNCDKLVFLIFATLGHRMNLLHSLKIDDMKFRAFIFSEVKESFRYAGW